MVRARARRQAESGTERRRENRKARGKKRKKGQKHRNKVRRESKCKKGARDGIKERNVQGKKFLTQHRSEKRPHWESSFHEDSTARRGQFATDRSAADIKHANI